MHVIEAKEILSAQNGMNLYRGCTHGCIYCDSRSRCYRIDHDFTDVAVKANAVTLLETALRRKRNPCVISTGGMSDPYIPIEREIRLTRRSLQVIADYGFGLTIQSKSAQVLDDLALFREIRERTCCTVQMTITTHDDSLCRIIEPEVSLTSDRLETLNRLHEVGIPTVVWLSPILPYINDTTENIDAILQDCAKAGVMGIVCFGMGVTMRDGNREYFYNRLDAHFPGMKDVYKRHFGYAYMCSSEHEGTLMRRAEDFCLAHSILFGADDLLARLRQMPEREQRLF